MTLLSTNFNLGEAIDSRIQRKISDRRKKYSATKYKNRKKLEDNRERLLKMQRAKSPYHGRTGGLCFGIHAPWSKGKTLSLVFFAKRRNEYEGLPLLANFRMRNVTSFTFLEDIEILKEIEGTGVFVDEIRRYMDSYMSRGAKARFTSNLTADLGKQSCDLYYSDQHYNAAPPRLKVNLGLLGEPDFDEESQWVTIYLYQTIEDYIMKNQFFYFGFYGPDYWDYYDTKYKVEDYRIKFKVDKYASQFLDWFSSEEYTLGMSLTNKDVLNLWNQVEGREFTASELSAIFTYLKIKGYVTKPVRVKKLAKTKRKRTI
jgi:hypothetical protein